MDLQQAKELIPILLSGKYTAKQEHAFNIYITNAPYNEVVEILDVYQFQSTNTAITSSIDYATISKKIESRITDYDSKNPTATTTHTFFSTNKNNKRYWLSAAAVLLLIAGTYYFTKKSSPTNTNSLATISNTILPGSNKAVLQLDNGSAVVLDGTKDSSLTNNNGVALTIHNAKLTYNLKNKNTAIVTYNTLSTPKGGQYQVTLPDGTKVWLNAASSIRFPTAFTGNDRQVNLTGEAYFEVAKNVLQPFIVHVNDMDVQVLGTHFNVMAYAEDGPTKTTLLEGSVKLSKANNTILLQPGNQGTLKQDVFSIYDVDVEHETAWKDGYFSFDKVSIQTIMRQLSRWYDVEVSYEGNIPTNRFKGDIRRSAQLGQVLKMLELSGIKFRMDNKKVIVLN